MDRKWSQNGAKMEQKCDKKYFKNEFEKKNKTHTHTHNASNPKAVADSRAARFG